MKIKDFINIIEPISEKCENDRDAFFCIYFSSEEDKYAGGDIGLDCLDLGIVIKEFSKRCLKIITDQQPPHATAYGNLAETKKFIEEIMEIIGKDMGKPEDTCSSCCGSGYIKGHSPAAGAQEIDIKCVLCNGTGKTNKT